MPTQEVIILTISTLYWEEDSLSVVNVVGIVVCVGGIALHVVFKALRARGGSGTVREGVWSQIVGVVSGCAWVLVDFTWLSWWMVIIIVIVVIVVVIVVIIVVICGSQHHCSCV